MQWIGICSAAALCLLRDYLHGMNARAVGLTCYVALLAVTFSISEIAWYASIQVGLENMASGMTHHEFLLRNLGLCAIVAAVGLRYFWLRDHWLRKSSAEADARYKALQAHIRPHFLFNTLNTIATLIATRPEQAEQAEEAVEDLSALLRANLGDSAQPLVPLADELAVTEAYARIEGLRLGERLSIHWDIHDDSLDWPVPPLCLQPLLENAIGHGISHLQHGGEVNVTARRSGKRLLLQVENPAPPQVPGSGGFHVAQDNIRQRLELRYGSAASMKTRVHVGRYRVRMRLPQGELAV
jgi:two-component system sensor histidine kinase AlgZ